MRVLHLFSNCKWTGPAEPALNLCRALRDEGVETEFACAPDAGKSVNMVVESARSRGLTPILDFHLRKHRHPWYNFQDVRRLRRYLAEHPFDIVHCHLDNDHEIAARALQGGNTPLVRSSYEGTGLERNTRRQRMLARTTALLEPSEMARLHDIAAFGIAPDRTEVVPGAIDITRFDPKRSLPDARTRLGLTADAYVIGIVARMQTHRHFEDLLQAMRHVVDALPEARLVIIGRGTHQEKVAMEPARKLGLDGQVIFTGYIEGDDFVAAIAAMDVGVYLVPGSDGTCRAARELLAMGKPVVVADRGMLKEIVPDGEAGIVTDGSVAGLANALLSLGRDPERRGALAGGARRLAETRYALGPQAEQVKGIYERILGRA
ncbi:MAG: glycosyltransferase family 4 protein [Candidatus Hydrogenedentes bacterium]|nr:glycosyltransferase family 4 protein [Candidatus Hydrogenedentota bacterium]